MAAKAATAPDAVQTGNALAGRCVITAAALSGVCDGSSAAATRARRAGEAANLTPGDLSAVRTDCSR